MWYASTCTSAPRDMGTANIVGVRAFKHHDAQTSHTHTSQHTSTRVIASDVTDTFKSTCSRVRRCVIAYGQRKTRFCGNRTHIIHSFITAHIVLAHTGTILYTLTHLHTLIPHSYYALTFK